ncbi:hypothetical protein ACTOJ1_000499 [Shigella flexneri]
MKKESINKLYEGKIEKEDRINKNIVISGIEYQLNKEIDEILDSSSNVVFTLDEENNIDYIESLNSKKRRDKTLYYYSSFNFLLAKFINNMMLCISFMLSLFGFLSLLSLFSDPKLTLVDFFSAIIQVTGAMLTGSDSNSLSASAGLGFYYALLLIFLNVISFSIFLFKKKKYTLIKTDSFKKGLIKNMELHG